MVVCLCPVQQMRAFLFSKRSPPVSFTIFGENRLCPSVHPLECVGRWIEPPCSASGASPKDDMEHGNNSAPVDAPLQMIATSYKNMLFHRFTMRAESYPCLSARLFLSRSTSIANMSFCLYHELLHLPYPVGILFFICGTRVFFYFYCCFI